MPVSAETEFDIDATPDAVMEVLRDVEALPDWSDPHQNVEVLERYDDGAPKRIRAKVSATGISDEMIIDYTWTDTTCSWELVEADKLSMQKGKYTVTATDGGAHVAFELAIDLKIKVPGFIVKGQQKKAVETARQGLTAEVLRRVG
ncbi:SRPBCC family protein [Williamsia sterculiae]|uniref:Polyketide cyclase / dehydrase and lipid transport n=1 Tax=Williamsia sterculiae TaxID=1344003 RepID=A0A1N7EY86_9NOCA|nr:SRPBCC family protein [Williamsia sterculiae]SIR93027.1 Polyketide cyclase / dehydrase and lipid transport [Williamsia sterculiae]